MEAEYTTKLGFPKAKTPPYCSRIGELLASLTITWIHHILVLSTIGLMDIDTLPQEPTAICWWHRNERLVAIPQFGDHVFNHGTIRVRHMTVSINDLPNNGVSRVLPFLKLVVCYLRHQRHAASHE